jgi:hypothetical protein
METERDNNIMTPDSFQSRLDELTKENKKMRREIWSLRAFIICVILVQLYDIIFK